VKGWKWPVLVLFHAISHVRWGVQWPKIGGTLVHCSRDIKPLYGHEKGFSVQSIIGYWSLFSGCSNLFLPLFDLSRWRDCQLTQQNGGQNSDRNWQVFEWNHHPRLALHGGRGGEVLQLRGQGVLAGNHGTHVLRGRSHHFWVINGLIKAFLITLILYRAYYDAKNFPVITNIDTKSLKEVTFFIKTKFKSLIFNGNVCLCYFFVYLCFLNVILEQFYVFF